MTLKQGSQSILFVILASLLPLPLTHANSSEVDVAPFGQPLTQENAAGGQWSEMRRIVSVEVTFANDASPLPPADSMKVEYWHRVWKGTAIRRYGDQNAGRVGWNAVDDWTNGEWKMADARVQFDGRRASFTFGSSEQKEFPDLTEPGVNYRPTLKVRVIFSGQHPQVASLRAFTDSTWRSSSLRIHFENRRGCDDPIEVYNGNLIEKKVTGGDKECILAASVKYAFNSEDPEADRTIVTVGSSSNPFSFAVDEVERGDHIYIQDFGVLVMRSSEEIAIPQYRRVLQASGAKSVYDRIQDHPEQTLTEAWNDMPLKRPYYFILGCEGGRQRFRLNPDGSLWMNHPKYSKVRPGKDNGHFLWPDEMVIRFGLPRAHFADRHLAEGYLPMVTTRWLDGDLLYEEEAFADLLAANINSAAAMQADDPTVAFVKVRMVNDSPSKQTAHLQFRTEATRRGTEEITRFETLKSEGDRVLGSFEGHPALRFLVDTRDSGRLVNTREGVDYELELTAHQEHTVFLKVPFITLTEESELKHLRSLNPERERAEVARYWTSRVAAGSAIRTPEPWLNDFYKAVVTHVLINDEREVGADRYAARVGSFFYGAFGNESIMMISDLDRRGYWKEAERSLELFLHYQGTVALPGNFSTRQGILYGAGGYEEGAYNQHHGWILWGLAEHYGYSRDRAWMERAAPHMVAACRWIANERKATMKLDAKGQRVREYGLLPAGSLEDVTDFWYWISTNSFSWWGMAKAAAALKDFGHPEATALVEEAENYRQDILQDYREAMILSPVVRLRDGTYVPHVPSNVYTRGRSYGWLRETLEGSIMLLATGLLDPSSREAQWILKDYEDNRYISNRFGYSIPVFDQFWFSRGGFSMQPNLLHGPLAYFYRDEIPHFVRSYFNPFAAAFDPTLRMLCEHPLPELGYFIGDHFKSSDETQSTYWLRLMFASELDGTLHLGRGIPRYWLKDGETIGIQNATTYFGKLSYEIRSRLKEGRIEMSLDPPARNSPREITVRFRHPEGKQIRKVTVNQKDWKEFDVLKGDIRLPAELKTHAEIVAEY